jgi:Pyruvate/2-oxoacid:ferredoxin oxidoreductase delta subunit
MAAQSPYRELAARIGLPDSEKIPELFRMIVDQEEVDLLLAMPGTVEEIAERTGIVPSAVEAMLEILYHKGLVFSSQKAHGVLYRMCRNLIQFHDATILWPEAPREFLDLWQSFMDTEWPQLAAAIDQSGIRPGFRVIPIGRTIQSGTRILPYDTARNSIEGARSLAVTQCTCRRIARKCEAPLEVCVQLDKAADYAVHRGTGRALTKEQALEILDEAEEAGLVHCSENRAGIGHVICNCCADCCQIMPMVIRHGRRLLDPSRFQAQIDNDKCVACGTCEERCMFQAIQVEELGRHVVQARCMGCGLCASACPEQAIAMEPVRAEEFIPN